MASGDRIELLTADTFGTAIATVAKESTLATVNSSVAGIANQTSTINSNVGTVNTKVSTITTNLATANANINTANSSLSTLTTNVETANSNITATNNNVVSYGNTMNSKLDTIISQSSAISANQHDYFWPQNIRYGTASRNFTYNGRCLLYCAIFISPDNGAYIQVDGVNVYYTDRFSSSPCGITHNSLLAFNYNDNGYIEAHLTTPCCDLGSVAISAYNSIYNGSAISGSFYEKIVVLPKPILVTSNFQIMGGSGYIKYFYEII